MSETELVCERCGQTHPAHPDSAKRGGVRLVMAGCDRLCLVCASVFDSAECGPRQLPQWLHDPLTGSQETLEAYQ